MKQATAARLESLCPPRSIPLQVRQKGGRNAKDIGNSSCGCRTLGAHLGANRTVRFLSMAWL